MRFPTLSRHPRTEAPEPQPGPGASAGTEVPAPATEDRIPFERLESVSPIVASPGDPTYLVSTRDTMIGPTVFGLGECEEDQLRWVLDYLGQPQRGRAVLDIGANIGTTTLPLLARYGASFAEVFEPDPLNYKLLRCNLILNDLDARSTAHRLAISDRAGTLLLERSESNLGDHRVRASAGATDGEFDEAGRSTVVVESKRLDDALETHPADIGFIWVDSQGHEAHILDGAPRLLRHSIPWVIEYWPYGLARSGGLERLHDLIEEHFGPVVDVRESLRREKVVAVSKNDLVRAASVMGTDHTDLILLPR